MNHFPIPNLSASPVATELSMADLRDSDSASASTLTGGVNGWARKIVLKKFGHLKGGQVHIRDRAANLIVGESGSDLPPVSVVVSNSAFYRKLLAGGTIGSAESYIDNDWGCDNLTDLIRIMIRNMDAVTTMERRWSQLRSTFHRLRHMLRRNTIDGSRRNIHQHYDLGNEFYKLFLDPTLNYSAGIFDSSISGRHFPDAKSTMHAASLTKMRHVCERLMLRPGQRVIEIGTGWGAMAMFMAENYDVRVTTTTISSEQYQFAVAAVKARGLEDRVTILQEDYRNLTGKFDRLVSIEMIEAVGHQFLDAYFAKCNELLKPDGAMLIQAITISEQNFDAYRKGVDFIRAYVFPGGSLPSISSINRSIGRRTVLRMVGMEDISQHYADTLIHWRAAFMSQLEEIKRLGFDDSFVRLWHFYLCYCEAAFAERRCNSLQLTFAKPQSPF